MSDTYPMPGTQLPNSQSPRRDFSDANNLPVLFQDSTSSSGAIADNGEQFLRISLASNTLALLPVQYLSEVLTMPNGQIMPIPHMTPWVMGAYNWRGEILWMVDLCIVHSHVHSDSFWACLLGIRILPAFQRLRQLCSIDVLKSWRQIK